jgi:release factor glutamine methyltransferase
MRLLHLPGVFRPLSDSRLLARVMRRELTPGSSVADVCTGSGALAVAAALDGAEVTAVDVSRRAVMAARLNARLNGVRVRALRGDLLGPCEGRRFDLIVSNPPYVPAETDGTPRGTARGWDAGLDGRVVIDRLCEAAAGHLRPGGSLLLVHSAVCGTERTLERLARAGLRADVVAGERGPLGPLLRERAPLLERRGLLEPGVREESVVVIRGRRASPV